MTTDTGRIIMHENKILITNIQRFSLHDGPGIRTTVFLKGCGLRCPWCSNPENQLAKLQEYEKDGLEGIYGKWYEPDELVKECLKDKAYYEGKLNNDQWIIHSAEELESLPGGVTFSGGEALLQMSALTPACEKLHESGTHIAVETSLFIPSADLSLAMDHIDLFYVDVKILNAERAREIEHGDLQLYLENFTKLMESEKPVVVRIPVIGNRTNDKENRNAVKKLLKQFTPLKIELIKEHNLGESKYHSLGMTMSYFGVEESLMDIYKNELSDLGIPVEICKV